MTMLLLPAILYILMMEYLRRALSEGAPATEIAPKPSGVSVVIAARNEAQALPRLLHALQEQDCEIPLEFILVDDGSTDNTRDILQRVSTRDSRFRIADTGEGPGGKKRALSTGIAQSRFDWIAVCDADSLPGEHWIQGMVSQLSARDGLLLGITRFESDDSLFQRIQQLEYAGILMIGLALAIRDHAMFASGSNMLYRKQAFLAAGGYDGILDIASGDDTFLIQRIRKHTDYKIRPVFDPDTIVDSRGPSGYQELFRQRARWASTHGQLPDFGLTLLGLITWVLVSSILVTGVLALFGKVHFSDPLLLLALKMLGELPFLRLAARRTGIPFRMRIILPGQLQELVYLPISPLIGLFGRFRWR